MNAEFQAGRFANAGAIAFEITALSRDELVSTFENRGVKVLHVDHEAFGIYDGQIEPTYDLHVDGTTEDVLAAASEFGKRHAQEMILIAMELREDESDPNQRLGVTILLNTTFTIEEALEIAADVRSCGFSGATFASKRNGTVAIYHTENLRITADMRGCGEILDQWGWVLPQRARALVHLDADPISLRPLPAPLRATPAPRLPSILWPHSSCHSAPFLRFGGWAPDSTGEISDARIQELIYPEIMHKQPFWHGCGSIIP